ncbi:MAG: hypothetical protein AB2604_10695 [Candidatus Thiodiazotropha taylori]
MDKELAKVVDRFEALHNHTMRLIQGQNYLNAVLIDVLLQQDGIDDGVFLECLYSTLQILEEQGASEDACSAVSFWFDTLSVEPAPPVSGRPAWFRGVIEGSGNKRPRQD